MSVTAFPVLARILTDRGINKSRLGTITLTCAAVDDVTAWCLLAFVVSVANTKVGGAVSTSVLSVCYIALVFIVLRPIARRPIGRCDRLPTPPRGLLAGIFVALLACGHNLATNMSVSSPEHPHPLPVFPLICPTLSGT